tara:strand:+ start:1936 stop:2337 length:402 start_codon:yes stop_codon:yes gene_type:complete
MEPLIKPSKIKYLTYPFLLCNLVTEKSITNKRINPIDSEKSIAWVSTTNSNFLPKMESIPDILFLNKTKLNISEKIRLLIKKYETGFVSLFIVLLKLNKRSDMKTDEIMGIPGISQAKFNSMSLNLTSFHLQQ